MQAFISIKRNCSAPGGGGGGGEDINQNLEFNIIWLYANIKTFNLSSGNQTPPFFPLQTN